MIDKASEIRETEKANILFLRDIHADDNELRDFFIDNGFVKIDMPENNIINNQGFTNINHYISSTLSNKKRYQLKKEIPDLDDNFSIQYSSNYNFNINQVYSLYLNVRNSSLKLNTFTLPEKLFKLISKSNCWEIMGLVENKSNELVVAGLHCFSKNSYSAVIFGMNHEFSYNSSYKKMLLSAINRGISLNKKTIFLGITANETKKKFGAQQIKQVAYVRINDTFNQDLIDNMNFKKDF